MSISTDHRQAIFEVFDILRTSSLNRETIATVTATLFFLKRVSDSGLPDTPSSKNLTGCWKSLNSDFDIQGAVLSLMECFEREIPILSGLSKRSILAEYLRRDHALESNLKKVVNILTALDLGRSAPEEVSQLFQEILSYSAGRSNEPFTPPAVCELLAGVVEAHETDSLYDPTCGSGALLLATSKRLKNTGFASILGRTSNCDSAFTAYMSFLLLGVRVQVNVGNILDLKPAEKGAHFDVIVANPPFGVRVQNSSIEPSASSRTRRPIYSEQAFLRHIIDSLTQDGRAAVIVPNGVLSRSGIDADLRQEMLESDIVVAVIGLPPHLFPGTAIATSILVLSRSKEDYQKGHVIFIDLSDKTEGLKTRRELTQEAIDIATNAVLHGKLLSPTAARVSIGEIPNPDYSLETSRYIKAHHVGDEKSLQEAFHSFKEALDERNRLEAEALRLIEKVSFIARQRRGKKEVR